MQFTDAVLLTYRSIETMHWIQYNHIAIIITYHLILVVVFKWRNVLTLLRATVFLWDRKLFDYTPSSWFMPNFRFIVNTPLLPISTPSNGMEFSYIAWNWLMGQKLNQLLQEIRTPNIPLDMKITVWTSTMKIYKIWLAFSKQCRQRKISHQRIQRKGEIKMREKKNMK